MAKISILMPVYNGEKYIENTVDTILDQSFRDWELIIANDGSTDNSKSICEKLEKSDKRIKFIHKEKTGVSDTRNILLDNATGEYVGFVDCDDIIDKKMYKSLLSNIEKYESDLVVCGIAEKKMKEDTVISNIDRIYYPKKIIKIHEMKDIFFEFGNSQLLNSLCNKLYKRDVIKIHNIRFDESIENGEDFLFNLEYMKYIKSIVFCKDTFYSYIRRGKDSITHKYTDDMYYKGLKIHKSVEEFLDYMGFLNEKNKKTLCENHLVGVFSAFLNLFHKDCKLNIKQKKEYINKIISRDYVKICADKRKGEKGIIGITSMLIRLRSSIVIIVFFQLLELIRQIKRIAL